MLMIRSRDELLKHISVLRDMAEAEAFANRRNYRNEPYSAGRAYGLGEAIVAIEAWERHEADTLMEDRS